MSWSVCPVWVTIHSELLRSDFLSKPVLSKWTYYSHITPCDSFKEVLEDGTSREVESTRQSEQFQTMKVNPVSIEVFIIAHWVCFVWFCRFCFGQALTGIFGVGVKTADRWFREGLRSPSDLICTGQQLNRAQQAGTCDLCNIYIYFCDQHFVKRQYCTRFFHTQQMYICVYCIQFPMPWS